jgi:hypothetical protein
MTTVQEIKCYYNKPSTVGGLFAPKEKIVYVLPSVEECIIMLPRDVGNLILSFTNYFIHLYLEKMREKYGDAFVSDVIFNPLLKGTVYVKNKSSLTIQECCSKLIRYVEKNVGSSSIFTEKDIYNCFKEGIELREKKIRDDKIRKIQRENEKKRNKLSFEALIINLPIGIIFSGHSQDFILLRKTRCSIIVSEIILYDMNTHYEYVCKGINFKTQTFMCDYYVRTLREIKPIIGRRNHAPLNIDLNKDPKELETVLFRQIKLNPQYVF